MRRTVRRSGVAVLTGAIVLSCEYRAAAIAPLPADQSAPSVPDVAAEVLPIRTFEFLAHRVSELSTDDTEYCTGARQRTFMFTFINSQTWEDILDCPKPFGYACIDNDWYEMHSTGDCDPDFLPIGTCF